MIAQPDDRRTSCSAFVAWQLVVLLALPAAGHDMWIEPPAPLPAGELVEVSVRVGHAGSAEPVLREPARIMRFAALGPSGESEVPGLAGSDPSGFFRPAEPGLWAVVYETIPAFSELDAETFRGYLEEEGLEHVVELRRQRGEAQKPGRELYSRSIKSLVRVEAAGEEAEGSREATGGEGDRDGEAAGEGAGDDVDQRRGLPLELVAETPLSKASETGVMLRLWLRDEPLAGALVELRRLDAPPDAPTVRQRTGDDGRLTLELTPGAWMAAVVHMESTEDPRADWRSIFSTLTFVLD